MMLKIKGTPERRRNTTLYLFPSDVDVLKQLAKRYKTTVSKIVEAMIDQYGNKLLEEGEEK